MNWFRTKLILPVFFSTSVFLFFIHVQDPILNLPLQRLITPFIVIKNIHDTYINKLMTDIEKY